MISENQLQALFDFTAEELKLNQSGIITPRQLKKAKKKHTLLKVILLAVSLPLIATAVVMIAIGFSTKILFGLAIGGIVMLVFTIPMAYFGVRPAPQIAIQIYEGPIKLARVQRAHHGNDTVSYYTVTELHIQGKSFTVPDETYSLLSENAGFKIYSENKADHIFSLEQLNK